MRMQSFCASQHWAGIYANVLLIIRILCKEPVAMLPVKHRLRGVECVLPHMDTFGQL